MGNEAPRMQVRAGGGPAAQTTEPDLVVGGAAMWKEDVQ